MPVRNRKQSANIHDKRHENGLAPPAVRKVSKSRLDPPTVTDAVAAPGLATGALTKPLDAPDTDDSDQQSNPDAGADGISAATHMAGSSKTSSEGSSEGLWDASADATADEQEPIAAAPSCARNGSVSRHDSLLATGSHDPAATIISPQPLRDVVAVLLLLLQLPPSILTIIQIGYAMMTLGQPLTAFSLSALPTWQDWFHSHGGNPSIVTTVITDLMFMLTWFMLTNLLPAVRHFTLDFAQSVIAMSLGGGTVTKGGWDYSLACVSLVTIPHLLRSRPWRRFAADPLRSIITKANGGFLNNVPFLVSARHSQHSWPRTILELHILAQGTVRVIRRWIDRQPGTASVRKIDPEAAPTPTSIISPASVDPAAEGARNASSDGRPPGPSPAARETKEKNVSSGKKRRKQGNFVRSQQPFWAAIASTKVTLTKEIEQTQASKDVNDAAAADSLRRGDADGKQAGLDDRVWISSVDQNEVSFVAITSSSDPGMEQNDDASSGSGSLSLRINGTNWSHFEFRGIDQVELSAVKKRAVKGRIYGLTPSENFFVEFIDRAEPKVIYSTHLFTRPFTSSDAGAFVSAAPTTQPQDSMRPSSPATTKKKSIVAAEHQLSDLRSRSKKTRKDHKTSNANLKKEVEALENRLSTSSGADERQRQRQAQFRQNIKQAEESVASITQQIDELADLPQSEQQAHEAAARTWQDESSRRSAAQEELERAKAEGERQVAALKAEHANVRQKIEKAETKLVNQEQKREQLQSSNTQARSRKSRWDAQRAAVLATWQGKERELVGALQYLESQRQEIDARTAQLQQQSYFFESSLQSSGQATVQHTPEAPFASLAGHPHRAAAFAGLQYPMGTSPVHGHSHSLSHSNSLGHSRESSARQGSYQHPRGRSSSMLSAISGFTEDETGTGMSGSMFGDFGNNAIGQSIPRRGSASSSGRGDANAKSPTPKMSPIGTGAGAEREAGRGSGSPRGLMTGRGFGLP